jgi:hypothetical protein
MFLPAPATATGAFAERLFTHRRGSFLERRQRTENSSRGRPDTRQSFWQPKRIINPTIAVLRAAIVHKNG